MAPFDEADSEPTSPVSAPISNQQKIHDAITNSKFSPLIQSWLRERVPESTGSYYSPYCDLPWSNTPPPYSVHNLENDIDRCQCNSDHQGVIQVASLMLKNGALGRTLSFASVSSFMASFVSCRLSSSFGNDRHNVTRLRRSLCKAERTDPSDRICERSSPVQSNAQ